MCRITYYMVTKEKCIEFFFLNYYYIVTTTETGVNDITSKESLGVFKGINCNNIIFWGKIDFICSCEKKQHYTR